jgi:5-methylthioribose kinase
MLAPTNELCSFIERHAHELNLRPPFTIAEVAGGNLNFVWRVVDVQLNTVFVKRAPPFVRVKPDVPLPPERLAVEAKLFKLFYNVVPGSVPQVLLEAEQWLVMEDLQHSHLLQDAFVRGTVSVHVAEQIAYICAAVTAATLKGPDAGARIEEFSNPAMVELTANFVFTFPFSHHPTNNFDDKLINEVQSLWADQQVLEGARVAKDHFLSDQTSIVHGDLHSGSVMVDSESGAAKIIDFEFGFIGSPAFDIGVFVAAYVFAFARHVAQRDFECEAALACMEAMEAIWRSFTLSISSLLPDKAVDLLARTERYAVLMMGCELIRRVVGAAHRKELETLEDDVRLRAERLVLLAGKSALASQCPTFSLFVKSLPAMCRDP